MAIYIRWEESGASVRAEPLEGARARLLEIPLTPDATLHDVVRYDPASEVAGPDGPSYRLEEVVEPSGYRAYLTWSLFHRPNKVPAWCEALEKVGLAVRLSQWVTDRVRNLILALPPTLSPLEALVLLNRHSPQVEVVCPLLAAHADDLERAKSDLERVVAWGAPDAEMTFAVAEAFEVQGRWDEAMPFWERLAHAMPTLAAARERLALSYAHLGVFPHAAAEFERAAHLTDDPEHRQRLEAARDLMWERSKV